MRRDSRYSASVGIIITALLTLGGVFWHPSAVLAAPGFIPSDDERLPKAIREASDSVFRITSQAGSFQAHDISDSRETAKLIKENGNDSYETMQVRYCQAVALNPCPIFSLVGSGTGFAVDNPNTLATNLHVIFGSASYLRSLDGRQGIHHFDLSVPILIRLRDRYGKVFFPLNDRESAHVTFANLNFSNFPNLTDMVLPNGRLSDYARLSLSREVSSPIKRSSAEAKIGEQVYLIGFPSETNDRRVKFGAMDSDGKSQYVSVGTVISEEQWFKRTQVAISSEQRKLFKRHLLFADLDCAQGNSGGPIVNARGEVLAVFMATYEDRSSSPSRPLCGGLKIGSEEELFDLWSKMSLER